MTAYRLYGPPYVAGSGSIDGKSKMPMHWLIATRSHHL